MSLKLKEEKEVFDIFLTQYNGTFLGPIAWVLGKILNAIYEFLSMFGINNAAVCIILFTFIVNAFMIPLTMKQQKFSKLSSRMAPELSKITAKYKGKKDEASIRAQQAETQAIYEKYGTSPTGGCLPMFVSMFILLALYRVMYAIPAYVDSITDLYKQIAEITQGNPEAMNYLTESVKTLGVTTKGWGSDIGQALANKENINYVIDVLSKFGATTWKDFAGFFSGTDVTTIQNVSSEIMHVNGFLGGLNIIETPMSHPFPGIIIPIVSVITQFVQTKMMTNSNPIDKDNPTAATMNTMNNVMPFVSGGFCLFLPVGLGIYWIAGSVFRIIQQFFVNRYMESVDLEEMLEKNQEKSQKKRERLGIETSNGSVKSVAQTRTNTMKEKAGATSSKKVNERSKEPSNYTKGEATYTKGSISSIANMLKSSGEKNKGE